MDNTDNTDNTDNKNTEPCGLIKICKGTVYNCDIDGVISAFGPVGMLAGGAEGAIVQKCNASGLIMGSQTTNNGLFGTADDNIRVQNTKSSVIFLKTTIKND